MEENENLEAQEPTPVYTGYTELTPEQADQVRGVELIKKVILSTREGVNGKFYIGKSFAVFLTPRYPFLADCPDVEEPDFKPEVWNREI
jgi:hypothetical protein